MYNTIKWNLSVQGMINYENIVTNDNVYDFRATLAKAITDKVRESQDEFVVDVLEFDYSHGIEVDLKVKLTIEGYSDLDEEDRQNALRVILPDLRTGDHRGTIFLDEE